MCMSSFTISATRRSSRWPAASSTAVLAASSHDVSLVPMISSPAAAAGPATRRLRGGPSQYALMQVAVPLRVVPIGAAQAHTGVELPQQRDHVRALEQDAAGGVARVGDVDEDPRPPAEDALVGKRVVAAVDGELVGVWVVCEMLADQASGPTPPSCCRSNRARRSTRSSDVIRRQPSPQPRGAEVCAPKANGDILQMPVGVVRRAGAARQAVRESVGLRP